MHEIADAATIKSVEMHLERYVSYIPANSFFYFSIEKARNLIIIMRYALARLPLGSGSSVG